MAAVNHSDAPIFKEHFNLVAAAKEAQWGSARPDSCARGADISSAGRVFHRSVPASCSRGLIAIDSNGFLKSFLFNTGARAILA